MSKRRIVSDLQPAAEGDEGVFAVGPTEDDEPRTFGEAVARDQARIEHVLSERERLHEEDMRVLADAKVRQNERLLAQHRAQPARLSNAVEPSYVDIPPGFETYRPVASALFHNGVQLGGRSQLTWNAKKDKVLMFDSGTAVHILLNGKHYSCPHSNVIVITYEQEFR